MVAASFNCYCFNQSTAAVFDFELYKQQTWKYDAVTAVDSADNDTWVFAICLRL